MADGFPSTRTPRGLVTPSNLRGLLPSRLRPSAGPELPQLFGDAASQSGRQGLRLELQLRQTPGELAKLGGRLQTSQSELCGVGVQRVWAAELLWWWERRGGGVKWGCGVIWVINDAGDTAIGCITWPEAYAN